MAEVDTSNGSITFGGLASNLDTNKIVAAMVESQRRPMAKIEQQQATLDAHSLLVSAIGDKVSKFAELARSMESLNRLLPRMAATSDPTIVTASAGEGVQDGVHQVEVLALARGERVLSAPLPKNQPAEAVGPGTITWQYEGETKTFEVGEQMTLAEVARALNDPKGGLAASVLFDGTSRRLSVRGLAVGQEAGLSLTDTSKLQLADAKGRLQEATDAHFVIDGQIEMTRPNNLVTDAIDGVTLRLGSTGPTQLISISADASHMLEKIEAFVEAFNEVREAVDLAIRPGRDFDRGRMVGDSTLRTLMDTLQRTVTSPVSGLIGNINSLAAIGVASDKEGKLKLDTAKLTNTVLEQPEGVSRLFGRDHQVGTRGIAVSISRIADQYSAPVTGALTLKVQSMARQRTAADGRLAQMQTNLDRFESSTRSKFTELEKTMTMMKSQNEKLTQQMKSLSHRD